MLEDHQRAAMMPNPDNVTWHHFVRSRFVCNKQNETNATSLAIEIASASLESHSHASLSGLMELSANAALPVVYQFSGTLDLENREVRLDDGHPEHPERVYIGSFSTNGRVLTLRAHHSGKIPSKELYLIHEPTLMDLYEE
ncbi:MAG: hypothetical protein EON54_14355 [Alcaligenaceae bacterium]|nr:MAG: hypothetical protein EON54_14355 [Alcaligenaceae bacterium]